MLKNILNPLLVNRNYSEPNIEIIITEIAMGYLGELPYYLGSLFNKVCLGTNSSQGAAKAELVRIKTRSYSANYPLSHQSLGSVPKLLARDLQFMR